MNQQKCQIGYYVQDYELERTHSPLESATVDRIVSREVDPAIAVNHNDQCATQDKSAS